MKKPIHKRWWFWGIIIVVSILIIGKIIPSSDKNEPISINSSEKQVNNSSNNNSSPESNNSPTTELVIEPEIDYEIYAITELFDALEDNALKAKNDFVGKYVTVLGYLDTIDSSGKYISIGADPDDYNYFLDSIHCTLKKDSDQLDKIMKMSVGDTISVQGKITDVGELLGFSMTVDNIY